VFYENITILYYVCEKAALRETFAIRPHNPAVRAVQFRVRRYTALRYRPGCETSSPTLREEHNMRMCETGCWGEYEDV
jgi:hypothetical protein